MTKRNAIANRSNKVVRVLTETANKKLRVKAGNKVLV